MTAKTYDLIVLGAGPGGEVGAIRAAQLGMKVALIDKRAFLGGTCLNVGCIPTKALLHAAKTWDKLQSVEHLGFSTGSISFSWDKIQDRKLKIVNQMRKGLVFLMKKNKVDVFQGHGRLTGKTSISVSGKDGEQSLSAKHILIATGSRVKELPFAKSNGKNILTSDHIIDIDHIPKSLCIVGGGVVGMEFASLFARMGSKVTVVEYAPQILPFEDAEVVKEATRQFKKQKIKIQTSSKLVKLEDNGNQCTVHVEGKESSVFDKVLMSVGREPVTQDIGLGNVDIEALQGGFLEVDKEFRTAIKNIYAIGDVIATPALAHTASAEATFAVEHLAGHNPNHINYSANPSAIYSYPEVAHIGMTEGEIKTKGIDYETVKFPFSALAKANIEEATSGFIKLIYDKKYREVLGAHIIGATATEMIAEFSLGKVLETTVDEIAHTIHPHPTISETAMEAAHMALGGAIHM